MRRRVAAWKESARAVGTALIEVLRAEAAALRQDLARSGAELRAGVILLLIAAAIAFWTVALALWTLVEALSEVLPRWGAAAVVLVLGLVATGTLLALARRRMRRVETPLHLVRRHGKEHAEWWQEVVLPAVDRDREEGEARADDGADGPESA